MKKIKLSVVIIARDEEKMIGECLKSIRRLETKGQRLEVIVVDHGSTDKTAVIAKEAGARVIELKREKRPNFAGARNTGLKGANGEWVLYLDADERITPALGWEIILLLDKPPIGCGAYAISRENVIFGKVMRHGGWWPDYVKRLYKRSELIKWEGELHEEPVIKRKLIKHLENPMRHIKHESLDEMVEKTNEWSEIEAELMYKAGHPRMNVARFVSVMAREFWRRMVKGTAFLDGGEGIIMALYQVYSRFISYAKLWERQMEGNRK